MLANAKLQPCDLVYFLLSQKKAKIFFSVFTVSIPQSVFCSVTA